MLIGYISRLCHCYYTVIIGFVGKCNIGSWWSLGFLCLFWTAWLCRFFKPVAVVAAFVVLACPLVDVMQYLNGSNLCFGVFVQLFFLKITSCG